MTENYRFQNKAACWWCRAIGFFWPEFLVNWWTAVRYPFCQAIVLHPAQVEPDLKQHQRIIEHEIMHVAQMSGPLGLLRAYLLFAVFPLPVIFSGRWFLEREPWLWDIRHKRFTVEQAVNLLWDYYGWPWPKPLMRRWFEKQLVRK